MSDLASSIPVLPSLDIPQSETFYREKLGFETIYAEDNYLIVRRDRMELHFWLTDNGDLPTVSSTYIRGGQIEDLFGEYEAAAVPGLSPFEVRPWNMKEFYIKDPHGNLLKFGMAPEEATAAL